MKWTSIEGWWGQTNASVYKQAIQEIPDGGIFVEVGCWMGRSSCCAAEIIKKSKKNIKLFCIDHWKGSVDDSPANKAYAPENLYELFLHNTKEHKNILTAIKKPSKLAAEQFDDLSINYVFIDASHDYKNVLQDIKIWLPKTHKIGGHDWQIEFPGVIKAVKEIQKEYDLKLKITGNIWELIKKENSKSRLTIKSKKIKLS